MIQQQLYIWNSADAILFRVENKPPYEKHLYLKGDG